MTATHWLAFLCLLVQCGVMWLVWRWIHALRDTAQAARDLTTELRLLRDTLPPDSEMVA